MNPGTLFAFNSSDFVNPWPYENWADFIAVACDARSPERMFVIARPSDVEDGVGNVSKIQDGLERCGIEFPAQFDVAATKGSGDSAIEIWEFRGE